MEKQEAIDYILKEAGNNRPENEIVTELSKQLNAPEDIVIRFVRRTLEQHAPPEPTIPDNISADWVPEIQLPVQEEFIPDEAAAQLEENALLQEFQEPAAAVDSVLEEPQFTQESLPEEGGDQELEYQQPEQYLPPQEFEVTGEILLEEEVQLSEPGQPIEELLDESKVAAAPTWESDTLASQAPQPLSEVEKASLEKAILAALSKQTRQSDVVMMVCERTGMSWNQAQRLVAEVSMKNRKKVNQRQGTSQILLSLLVTLVGLSLIFLVLSELLTFYRLYSQPAALETATSVMLDRYVIWAGIIGILLFLGGTTGIALGIKKRMD